MTAAAPAAAASHANHDISTPPFAYIYVDYSFFLTDLIKTINAKKMYDSIWNNYFERIDDIRVRVIQADVLQLIMNANMDKKRTCQKIKIVFNQVFMTAVRERIIYYNFAEYLVIPPYKSSEKRKLTDDEDTLSEISNFTDKKKAFILLIKYFGLWKEEALSVHKSSFLFDKKQLKIKDAIIFDNNQPVKETKSETGEKIFLS